MVKEEIFLLLLIAFNLNNISSYIILPFNFSFKNNNLQKINLGSEPKSYFEYYMNNTIYSKIKVNDQLITFRLSMDTYATFISDKIYQPKNLDLQEIKIDKNFTLNYINLNKVKMLNDSFYFQKIDNTSENSKELTNFNNYTFFQVNKYTDDSIEQESAIIGLNRVKGAPYKVLEESSDHWGCKYEEDTNMIGQLKKRKIINSTLFSIKYNNLKEEGEIIIGEFPHEYDKNNYFEKNLYYNRVTCYTCPPFNYYSRFNQLFYDNKSLLVTKTFQISIDHGFIEAPLSVKKEFDPFFEKYKDYCKEENLNDIYVFYCKKEAVENFKSIVFYFQNREIYKFGQLNDFNLEFNYKDLFIKKNDDLYYFQIIFKKTEDWIFGKPLFKKYRLVFDQNNKMYGIYSNLQKGIEEEQENKSSFNKEIIFWIVIISLGIIVFVESYCLIKKKCLQSRNKRPNELKDEYDYNNPLNSGENKNSLNY